MAQRDFWDKSAKESASAAIKKVEAQTSAEVVIAVRRISGSYRAADLWLGSVLGMVSLTTMIYSPHSFRASMMPLDVAIAFGLGVLLSTQISPLRRLLSGRRVRENVEHAAKAAFYDLGIAKTHRRQGILVFASMFEARVTLVLDVGVTASAELTQAEASLSKCIARHDFAGFIAAVEVLGPTLGAALPHKEDDANELSDEMQ